MERHYYLLRIQYLGFRYSGWQRQPGQKTIEGMLLKTLKYVLPDRKYKILGSSRTDSRVSSLDGAFELFLEGQPLSDENNFKQDFNLNLPPDIRILEISKVSQAFNIINDASYKEYQYLFACGEKLHPFCAPIMAGFPKNLDIPLMQEGASLFMGTHNFSSYTTKDQKGSRLERTVSLSELLPNTEFMASFFPDKSYVLRIGGYGFVRYQVRMIMGALVSLGSGKLSLDQLRTSLNAPETLELTYIAPGSGLHLHQLDFREGN
ncbi:tRNA pseudouridine(38-40) synthase TruA [Flavobacteriaceae bacterium D16]|nr:tRNA pseudouridine(38-40) synthase TruA [Flavobacteriaceae bacterium D16]